MAKVRMKMIHKTILCLALTQFVLGAVVNMGAYNQIDTGDRPLVVSMDGTTITTQPPQQKDNNLRRYKKYKKKLKRATRKALNEINDAADDNINCICDDE